jgi:subtilisin family serine protease
MDFNCGEWIISDDYTDFLGEYQRFPYNLAEIPNICYNKINDTHIVIYTAANALEPNLIQKYGFDVIPKLFGLMDVGSLEASGIVKVRNLPALKFRGEGTLIGFIDTGIDYRHEAFRKEDGTTRILSLWDQTLQTGSAPETYYYGTEYTREQINEALVSSDPLSVVPSMDEIGHGTALAGIAAGTPNAANNFAGVASEADIIVVKLKQAKRFLREFFGVSQDAVAYQENDIMFGIRYIYNIAKALNKPLSICIGLGTSQGSHDSTGALSKYLSLLADQNAIAITIAAGNEGNTGHHFRGEISKGNDKIVELKVGSNEPSFSMELWGKVPGTFSIDIMSPTGEYIPRIPARLGESRDIRFIFEKTLIRIDYLLIEAQSGDQLIFMRFTNPTEGIWKFRVYSKYEFVSFFDIWLPIQNFLKSETRFTQPDPYYTLTTPANAGVPMVATAYNYTNNSLYLNASKGFSRTDIIVPNFAAPGVNLIAPAPNNSYAIVSGTSFAAAHTTGVAALLLQWSLKLGTYYQLDSVEIKNYLIRGAKREPGNTYPNRDWGYGILDLYNTFISLREES